MSCRYQEGPIRDSSMFPVRRCVKTCDIFVSDLLVSFDSRIVTNVISYYAEFGQGNVVDPGLGRLCGEQFILFVSIFIS